MNYGYDPTLKDIELYHAIRLYLEKLPLDKRGRRAYPELNGLYPGVRIRRLTHYSKEIVQDIVTDCDRIYEKVVGYFPDSLDLQS